jgi:glycine oxidase
MNSKNFDFAVIGQGISGTLMSYFLSKAGKNVIIIDNNFSGSSSKIAAGIVNPITGKKFVKSWRVHEFLPEARLVYTELSQYLEIKTYTEANIIRSLYNVEDENVWLSRTADPEVKEYMLPDADTEEFGDKVSKPFAYGELKGTFQVHWSDILETYKLKWLAENRYLIDKFEYNHLEVQPGLFKYKELCFREIIFCEGYQAAANPYFENIGLAPSKGEVLLVRIQSAGFSKMYKDNIFIVHQYDDVYWVGSGYEWNMTDDLPTDKMYIKLKTELERILKVPFEILAHQAAIRPTMFSRRPIFKCHPSIEGMYIFNGLGTKGSSIAPFAAKQFARYILEKNPEDLLLL